MYMCVDRHAITNNQTKVFKNPIIVQYTAPNFDTIERRTHSTSSISPVFIFFTIVLLLLAATASVVALLPMTLSGALISSSGDAASSSGLPKEEAAATAPSVLSGLLNINCVVVDALNSLVDAFGRIRPGLNAVTAVTNKERIGRYVRILRKRRTILKDRIGECSRISRLLLGRKRSLK